MAFSTKPVKWWSGSAWVIKPVKVWSGSAWVTKLMKVEGSAPPAGPGWQHLQSSHVPIISLGDPHTERTGTLVVDIGSTGTNRALVLVFYADAASPNPHDVVFSYGNLNLPMTIDQANPWPDGEWDTRSTSIITVSIPDSASGTHTVRIPQTTFNRYYNDAYADVFMFSNVEYPAYISNLQGDPGESEADRAANVGTLPAGYKLLVISHGWNSDQMGKFGYYPAGTVESNYNVWTSGGPLYMGSSIIDSTVAGDYSVIGGQREWWDGWKPNAMMNGAIVFAPVTP